MKCSVDGCDKISFGHGWCRMHYTRWLRYGDPLFTNYLPMPDRFWSKVDKSSDCWTWTGAIAGGNGYGSFRYEGKNQSAHRVAYMLTRGDIPEGLTLDHLCRNRRCVNPDHLEAVTNQTNILRGYAVKPKPTHCKHGHEFIPENVFYDRRKPNTRGCRTCRKERSRAAWQKRIAARRLHNDVL